MLREIEILLIQIVLLIEPALIVDATGCVSYAVGDLKSL
jgi:hypothetical protein